MGLHTAPDASSAINDINASQDTLTAGLANRRGSLITGKATLTTGTVTVSVPGMTAKSAVHVTPHTPGGTMGAHHKAVSGTDNFVITAVDASGATVATDTSTLQYTAVI